MTRDWMVALGMMLVCVFLIFLYIKYEETFEEVIYCAIWLPGFLITNLLGREYQMSIAEYYYSPLKRYFAKFAKRLVIILLISDKEIHYCKGHLVKRPEIEEVVPSEREILVECGLIRREYKKV